MISSLSTTPSFYVWSTWTAVLVLLGILPTPTDTLSLQTLLLALFVIVCGLVSNLMFRSSFNAAVLASRVTVTRATLAGFAITTFLGFLGMQSYFSYAITTVGGLGNYIELLRTNPLGLRALSIDDLGGVVQLTYFSWISFTLSIFIFRRSRLGFFARSFILSIGFMEFLANLAFIDRTRPVWLLVLGFFAFALSSRQPKKFLQLTVKLLPVVVTLVFLLFASITQKVTSGGVFETISQYTLGGILYLNYLVEAVAAVDYEPVRIFYPLSKILSAMGFVDFVPSQILEFHYVPFPTNIGSFVEPLFSDGGFLFAILGIPLVIFGTDFVALWALRTNTALGMFVYSNLAFCNLMSFFVAKFTSTPIYLFFGIFVVLRFFSYALTQARPTIQTNLRPQVQCGSHGPHNSWR